MDVCKDVQIAEGEFRYDMEVKLPGFEPYPASWQDALADAADLINAAESPLIMAGHGIHLAGVSDVLLRIVEKAEIPVVTTLLGTGNITETHPLSLGMGGMHGEAYANEAVQACDVLIALGMRFDDRITGRLDRFAKQASVVHFELDKAEVGKNVQPDVAVVGDLAETLPALEPLIHPNTHPEWLASLTDRKLSSAGKDILTFELDELVPPFVMRQIWSETTNLRDPGDVLVATDVGQHQMWESQYFVHERAGQLLTSGGLGTMGYGLPAAMGAQMAWSDKLVWAIVGDGGFQMTMQELATIQQEKAAGQDCHHQQRFSRHGASVAAALSRQALRGYAGPVPRLRNAGGRLRGYRPARWRRPGQVAEARACGEHHGWSVPDRLPGQGGGQRVSDGGARRRRGRTDSPAAHRAGPRRRGSVLLTRLASPPILERH